MVVGYTGMFPMMCYVFLRAEFSSRFQKAVERATPGATIIPIIISSDKTRLTQFKGKSAYPVYLTIGNILKALRKKLLLHPHLLVGYLLTDSLAAITNGDQRRLA